MHLEKICSVCGGHNISITFPPRNQEGYYAYSSKIGRKLCLIVCVRTLSLLRSRHKNPCIHTPCDLQRFWFMINFALCFMIGKAYEWGTMPKCKGQTRLLPCPRHLIENAFTLRFYPTLYFIKVLYTS